jgi:pentatricopeptide repeat protein
MLRVKCYRGLYTPLSFSLRLYTQQREPDKQAFFELCQIKDLANKRKLFDTLSPSILNENHFRNLIIAYVQENQLENANTMLQKMHTLNIQPTVNIFRPFIDHCLKTNASVGPVIQQMKQSGVPFNEENLLSLVQPYLKREQYAHAFQLFSLYFNDKNNPTKELITYTLQCCSHLGHVSFAKQIFEMLPALEIDLDAKLIETYVDILRKDPVALDDYFSSLEEKHKSTEIFNKVLMYFVYRNRLDLAEKWLKKENHNVNEKTVETMTTAYVNAHKYEEAKVLFQVAQERGVKLLAQTQASATIAFLKSGDLDTAMQIYLDTKIKKKETLQILLQVLVRKQLFDRAQELVQEKNLKLMKISRKTALDMLIKECANGAKMEQAVEFMRSMKKSGLREDAHTYYNIISGFMKAEQFGKAKEMLAEMKTNGVPSDEKISQLEARLK